MPHLPLLWTEWNVPGDHERRDTPYVGPALAEAIRTCDGMLTIFRSGRSPMYLKRAVRRRDRFKVSSVFALLVA